MNPIDQLNDIVLPEPIHWWPLAWGWYGLFLFILLISIGLFYLIRRWLKQAHLKKAVRSELERIQQLPSEKKAAALSALLKRVAIQIYGRSQVAQLHGQAWLDWLNAHSDRPLPKSAASSLINGPYQPHADWQNELLNWAEHCLNQWLKEKKSA